MALRLMSRKLGSRFFPMFSSTTQRHSHATSFGDELLFNSFPYKEIENGMLWEVEGKGADEDEGVDDQAVKVVDIVDTFRLQEQPPFDKKQFVTFMKRYIKLLTPKLEPKKQELFKKHIEGATKFLLSKLSDLQLLKETKC